MEKLRSLVSIAPESLLMKSIKAIALCLFSVLASLPIAAAEERLPEEITVTGEKRIFVLEKEVREAKEAVYDIYNELNTDDRYNFQCRWEKPLGTNTRYRLCRPQFLNEATQRRGMYIFGQVTGFTAATAMPVELEYAHHMPNLRKKMQEIVEQSPELAEAMSKHQALEAQLNARITD